MSAKRIKELSEKIMQARDAYYNSDAPIMTDASFDNLVDELKKLDPENKAVIMVGAPLRPSEWKKAKHEYGVMASLEKENTAEGITAWMNKVNPGGRFCLYDKMDGISISLVYEKSRLVQAITRGSNGVEGENIYANVVNMGGVIQKLPVDFTGSIRGEIFIKRSVFNKHYQDRGKNPRNLAAGVSKRYDANGTSNLDVFVYQVAGNVDFKTEEEQFKWLVDNGFKTPNFYIANSPEEAINIWQQYQKKTRAELDYDIDGLVLRVNDIGLHEALGVHGSSNNPKWSIALKFPSEANQTILMDVEWEVGGSGRVTPVAILKPIIIAGAEISRASLHNVKIMSDLKLYKGCTVLVSRRNDVIPYIEAKIL